MGQIWFKSITWSDRATQHSLTATGGVHALAKDKVKKEKKRKDEASVGKWR